MVKKRNTKYRYIGIVIILVILASVLLATLELTNTTHLLHSTNTITAQTGGEFTKGSQSPSVANKNTTSSNYNNANDNTTSTKPGIGSDSSSSSLIQPSGTFANVYSASINEQMGSTCNTTPSATCQIFFTNGNTVKSLPIKNADNGGGVYWAWKPKDISLTPGTWHITAKATLGSNVKVTNNDPLTLEINE